MVMKRVIMRKRAMASNDDNEMTATEATSMTTTTMAINARMTSTTLMMMTKTTTKMTPKRWFVGGSWRWLAAHHPLVLRKATSLVCTSLKIYLLKLIQNIL